MKVITGEDLFKWFTAENLFNREVAKFLIDTKIPLKQIRITIVTSGIYYVKIFYGKPLNFYCIEKLESVVKALRADDCIALDADEVHRNLVIFTSEKKEISTKTVTKIINQRIQERQNQGPYNESRTNGYESYDDADDADDDGNGYAESNG